jgi:hypothetical protein
MASFNSSAGNAFPHWNQVMAQADYLLSPQTDVYLEGVYQRVGGGNSIAAFDAGVYTLTPATGNQQAVVAVGLKHRFQAGAPSYRMVDLRVVCIRGCQQPSSIETLRDASQIFRISEWHISDPRDTLRAWLRRAFCQVRLISCVYAIVSIQSLEPRLCVNTSLN